MECRQIDSSLLYKRLYVWYRKSFTTVPADLDVGGATSNFGWLLSSQESKAPAVESAGEACSECPLP